MILNTTYGFVDKDFKSDRFILSDTHRHNDKFILSRYELDTIKVRD